MANLSTDVTAYPSFPIETTTQWASQRWSFEDGSSQGYYTADKKLRKFKLRYGPMTYSEYNSLLTFYNARRGPYETFFWNHPDTSETNIPVYFDPKEGLETSWEAPIPRFATVTLLETV